jgi:hypothetical protein
LPAKPKENVYILTGMNSLCLSRDNICKSFLKRLDYAISMRYTNQPRQRPVIISGGHESTKQDLSREIATIELFFSLDGILDNASQFHGGMSGAIWFSTVRKSSIGGN